MTYSCTRTVIMVCAIVFLFSFAAPVSAMASGDYYVFSSKDLPSGGNPLNPLPVSWWEVPPFVLLLFALCIVSPLLAVSAGLFYATGTCCVLGFRRVTRREALDHPLRSSLHSFIRNNPGMHFSAIADATGINRGTLHYHLSILLRVHAITEMKEGGKTAYFENNGCYSINEQRILSCLHSGTAGDICSHLALHRQGSTRTEISLLLGRAPSSVSWHLARLSKSGIVAHVKEGRRTVYFLTQEARTLLGASEKDSLVVQIE